jgi:tRNA 2-thiouridine synthesizing protein A
MSREWFGRREPAATAASAAAPPAARSDVPEALIVIDALGRKCPIPIIMLAEQIGGVPIGSVIAVLADDPAAYTDIPAWCAMKSHALAFREDYQAGWSFGIRRNY